MYNCNYYLEAQKAALATPDPPITIPNGNNAPEKQKHAPTDTSQPAALSQLGSFHPPSTISI